MCPGSSKTWNTKHHFQLEFERGDSMKPEGDFPQAVGTACFVLLFLLFAPHGDSMSSTSVCCVKWLFPGATEIPSVPRLILGGGQLWSKEACVFVGIFCFLITSGKCTEICRLWKDLGLGVNLTVSSCCLGVRRPAAPVCSGCSANTKGSTGHPCTSWSFHVEPFY